MQKGVEIRLEDLDPKEKYELTELFIKIPQIRRVQQEVEKIIDMGHTINDAQIRFIYGDYGHGKSQTANLVINSIENHSSYSSRLFHLEHVSYFRSFIRDSSANFLKALKARKDNILIKVEDELYRLSSPDNYLQEISLAKIIDDYLVLLHKMSNYGTMTVLFFDELDKILHDKIDLTEWADFFVAINDRSDLKLAVVGFLPQLSGQQLRLQDTRFERWNNFFDVYAIYLDGRYESDILPGVANIFALSEKYHNLDLNDYDIEMYYAAFKHREIYLNNSSIRAVNLWGLAISELINGSKRHKLRAKISDFHKKEKTNKGFLFEKKMKNFLNKDILPQFEVKREDSDDAIGYRIQFSRENIATEDHLSDGHFKLYERTGNTEIELSHILVEIKYTEETIHVSKQIAKVKKLSEYYPVIFFSLGPTNNNGKDLQQMFQEFTNDDPTRYPIDVINIPRSVLMPLLIAPDDVSNFREEYGILLTWSQVMTDHRNLLFHFLRELPSKLVEREIELRTYQLMGKKLKKGIKPSPPTLGGEVISESNEEEAKLFFVAKLVARIENIVTYSAVTTVQNNISKDMKKKKMYSNYSGSLLKKFQVYLEALETSQLIEITKKRKKDAIVKSGSWDDNVANEILKKI
ncbi:MAG: hypothetical protein HeimC2_11010 [Candidatus Heimdallarchaeota archaeon LC_2]|nr:MAG: hypothetical protein HeimC2_11010 [Candidatus Heimdallarchaeota archaeon LC_2]